jgi:hypothetical protein
MYRVGWPGWKIAGRLGVPLLIKLGVLHDREAGVYVVTSKDLPGLVVEIPESATVEQMHKEIDDCAVMLLSEHIAQPSKAKAVTAWPGEFVAA